MKVVALSSIVAVVSALDTDAAPIAKVLQILTACEAKVIKEGEEAQKVYAKFSQWCEGSAANLNYELKTAQGQSEGLQATVAKETSDQQVFTSQIEDIAADIATDEKDLAAAKKVRSQESADFQTGEKNLVQTIDTLTRAISLIEKEMAGGGASMMQLKSANSLKQVFSIMVQASSLNTADAAKLTAFVQSSNDDDDFELGAPAGAVYENQSGGIVDVLQGLYDQANEQLDKLRKQERAANFNYEKLKKTLEDSVGFANQDLSAAKKGLAASREAQATAQGDLDVTQKDLAQDRSTLAGLHHTCMTTSQDFETETKSRSAELKGVAAAKEAISNIRGAGPTSLLQISSAEDPAKLAVRLVRNLARKQKDKSLAQLASRMASTVAVMSRVGESPFAKIKEMMVGMISKLEAEAAADVTQKAYCDKEMAETREKIADKQAEVEKLTTRIEQRSSASAMLKEEVATLQEELAKMIKEQLEMDTLRQKEKADYDFNKAEMTDNLQGVKYALKVLRDFYGSYVKEHTGFSSQDGSAEGVIALIETIESEFSMSLVKMTTLEEAAVAEYNEATKAFGFEKIVKEKAIKYKTREGAALDKHVSEHTSDREGVQAELDANNDALSKLSGMCVGKAETYEERVARREEEIANLKNSLESLEEQSEENPAESVLPAVESENSTLPAVESENSTQSVLPAVESENSLVQRSVKHFRGGVRTRTA